MQQHLVGTVRESLQVPRAALFWLDLEENLFVPVVVQGFHTKTSLTFSFKDNFVAWMNVNRRHLHMLKDSFKESPQCPWPLDWFFPIMSLNRLTGFLALGGRSFEATDVDLLRSLVNLGGVALHNAALHQRQQEVAESFHRAEKVALAGQFAAAAAHEIRNPLTSIRSTVQYVYQSLEKTDRRQPLLKDVLEEVDRINEVVEGLLSSVRPKAPAFQRVDLVDLIHKVVTSMRFSKSFEVSLDLDEKCREVVCDPDQIRQVLLNLIQNALQAMGTEGTLTVNLTLEPASTEKIRNVSPHHYRLSVADTGSGMPKSVIKRIFDPFYTTKAKTKGTGLGLSICRGIIDKHGGEIQVYSQSEKGTTFEILLPVNRM